MSWIPPREYLMVEARSHGRFGLLGRTPMRDVGGKRSTRPGRGEQPAGAGPGPGKQTLTEMLPAVTAPVQRKPDANAAGQQREAHATPGTRPAAPTHSIWRCS